MNQILEYWKSKNLFLTTITKTKFQWTKVVSTVRVYTYYYKMKDFFLDFFNNIAEGLYLRQYNFEIKFNSNFKNLWSKIN